MERSILDKFDNTYTIAVATSPADFEAISRIYNVYIERGNATMEETPTTGKSIAEIHASLQQKEAYFTIRSADREVIGWAAIKQYSPREGYRFAAETALYLEEDFCGRGLGKAVKYHIFELCKEWGYHHLVSKIFAENTQSIRYNTQLGYEMVGVQKEIGWKNNRWVDIAIMQKHLT